MANNYYNFPTAFVPGTKVRSEQVNVQYQGVESGFDLLPTDPAASIIGTAWLGTDVQGATVNDYLITTPDPQSALANGQRVAFFATHTNTGAATINVDGLGVVNLVDNDGAVLGGGNIVLGQYYEVVYDNANTQFTRSLAATQTVPVGLDTELLFNNAGSIEGVPTMTWDGFVVAIVTTSGNAALYLQQDDPNTEAFEVYTDQAHDGLVFMSIDNAGSTGPTLTLANDGSGPALFSDAAIQLDDNTQFQAGTGADFTLEHTGALSLIDNQTGAILIRNSAIGQDIVFNVNTTGTPEQVLEIGYAGEAGVRINHNGNQRFQTTDNGIEIIGYSDVGTAATMSEQAAVPVGPIPAGSGTYWVRSDVPSVAMFTDDTGVDFVLNSVTATPGGANTNVQFNNAGALDGDANFIWDGAVVDVDGGITLSSAVSGTPDLRFEATGEAADARNWQINITDNEFVIRSANDAYNSFGEMLKGERGVGPLISAMAVGSSEVDQIDMTAASAINIDCTDTNLNASNAVAITAADLVFTEKADHVTTPVATLGLLWVRSDVPNILVFTDDAGTDWDLNTAGASVGGADTEMQYNNGGVFGGTPQFVFNDGATTTAQFTMSPLAGLTTGDMLALSANVANFDGAVLSVLNDNVSSQGDAVSIVSDSGGRALYVNQQNNLAGVVIEQTFNTNLEIICGGSTNWGIDVNQNGFAGGAGIRVQGSEAATSSIESRVGDGNSGSNTGLRIIHEFGTQVNATHMTLVGHPNVGGEPASGAGVDGGIIVDDNDGFFWQKMIDGGGLSNKWWCHEISKKFSRVLTTSGTLHTVVSDMPTWVTEVIIIMANISTNGVSPIKITVGPSGSPVLTGYNGRCGGHDSGNTMTNKTWSSGFHIGSVFAAATTFSGTMRLTWSDSTEIWNAEFTGSDSTGRKLSGGGSIDITGNVDTIELDTDNHTDTFDNGEFTVILRGAGRSSEVF